jgi:hypothetical protein
MIDFAAIADAFRQPLLTQTAPTVQLFEKLADAVKDLVKKSDAAERATRAYPILRYRDGAVGVRLALTPSVTSSIAASGMGIGVSFGRLRGDITDSLRAPALAVQSEDALDDIALPVLQALAAVETSLVRHAEADPRMFDAHSARFADLFGIANLGWSSLLGQRNPAQIRDAAGTLAAASQLPGGGTSQTASVTGPSDLGSTLAQLGVELGDYAMVFEQSILLAPVLTAVVNVLVQDGVLAAEEIVLRRLGSVEDQAYRLRSQAIDAWLTGFELGSVLHYSLAAVQVVVGVDDVFIRYGLPLWCNAILDSVERFGQGLSYWGAWTGGVVRLFQAATTDLMGMDIIGAYLSTVMPGWVARLLPVPSLTLDDIVAVVSGEGDPANAIALQGWLSDAEVLLSSIPTRAVKPYLSKLDDIRTILGLTMLPTRSTLPPDVLPAAAMAGFPDVYEAFFGGGGRATVLAAVTRFGSAAHSEVTGILRGGGALMSGMADLAVAEGNRQAQHGAGLALAGSAARSTAIVGDLFAGLRADTVASAPSASLAGQAFDEAAAAVGIRAAAAAIPAFVSELRPFWEAHTANRPQPTSPHILARRARLAAVRMPRLTVTVHDLQPGPQLARQTATRFHGVVDQAYREGMTRIASDAAAAERAERPRAGRRTPRAAATVAGGDR